jgi:hypothetical protein
MFTEVMQLKAKGYKAPDIAMKLGITVTQVYNLSSGRITLSGTRKDKGIARYDIIPDLVAQCRVMYLQQSKINNRQKVIDTVYDTMIRRFGSGPSKGTLRKHVDEAYEREGWKRQFLFLKRKHDDQVFVPKSYYDRSEWPFMGWWIMDGRKSDALVMHEGSLRMVYGYFIREAHTGRVVGFAFSLDAFNALDVIRLVVRTAKLWGPPQLGFVLDNGMEQLGSENVLAMEALWLPEVIEDYRLCRVNEMNTTFPNSHSPIVTAISRIPTFPMKAAIESMFKHIQGHFDAIVGGNNYMGSGREDQVHTTLNRSPRKDKTSLTYDEFVSTFTWYLTATGERCGDLIPYLDEPRPKALMSFSRSTHLPPTCGNAWDYNISSYVPVQLTDDQMFRVFMHTEERLHKRITADAQIRFRRNNEDCNFICPALSFVSTGSYADLVLHPEDDTKAAVIMQGKIVGLAEDLDRKRRQGRMTRAATSQIMAEVRTEKRHELQASVADYKAKKFPAKTGVSVPEKISPFVIEGENELLNMLENKTSDALNDGRFEIDDQVAAFAQRYLVNHQQPQNTEVL